MGFLLAALAGWCGTGWPHIPFTPPKGGSGGGGTLGPGDWGPRGCTVCTWGAGVAGGLISYYVIGPQYADTNLLAPVVLGFIGGSVLGNLSNYVAGKFARQAPPV